MNCDFVFPVLFSRSIKFPLRLFFLMKMKQVLQITCLKIILHIGLFVFFPSTAGKGVFLDLGGEGLNLY